MFATTHPLWTSEPGFEIAVPKTLGDDVNFGGMYGGVRSVIKEFAPSENPIA